MRCYIELECEHGEIIKTVLIGETNGQKLKTRVQNICQYPFLRTVLAEDVDDKIEHMIQASYHQLSLKLFYTNICQTKVTLFTPYTTCTQQETWLNLVIMDTVCSCTEKMVALCRN